jgi:hypothetical protein
MVTQQESIGKSSAVSGNSAGSKSNTQKDKKNKKNTGNVTKKVTTYKTTGTLITLTAGQDNPVNELTSDLVGGTITITNPHTLVESDLYTTAAGYTLPTTYSSTILKVKNSKEFEVLEPYKITDKNNKTFPVSLKSGNTTITYDTYKTFTEDRVYQRSYANITVGNLRTFSGDVYKAKIYTRDSGTSTDYEQVYENYVIPENELIDESSITGYDNIGFFHTESVVDNNWISSSTAGDTGQFVTLTNEKLIDSVSISGSVSGINDKVLFRTKNANTLQKGVDYVVRFNTYYYKSLSERRTSNDKIENKNYASLKVYLSGSAITGANGEDDFFVGEVDVTDSMGTEGEILGVVGQFRTAGTGTTKTWLKFELNSGEFHIQDVSIEPFSETNFNPNFFKALVPMPKPVKRGDSYDFLVEFYDCNNNISTTTAEVKGVTFQGPRQVVADGLDGVFEGAMVLGESVEMYGSNPAYIRSVGYNGFDKTKAGTGERNGGFLIWSGSIGNGATLNRLTASEAYEGVGIEILDASGSDTYNHSFLQFASNYKNTGNSRFRIQTKEFLLGLSGSGQAGDTYISGSAGKLEISSSNFLLARDGSVTLQGTITATAGGQIGGFTITDKAISTTDFFLSGSAYSGTGFQKTNLVLSSSGFQINSDGQISASKGVIGGFGIDGHSLTTTGVEINDSTQGLFISSSTFKVDHSGNVTASNVDLSGKITATTGEIGGFTIDDHSLTSTGIEINDSTQTYFISSSNFKVKHTGEVSGSNVLFTGGEIGGFTITDSALSSGNTFFISGSPGTTDNLLKPNLLISSSNFLVSGVGRISASRGQIGGFDITDTFISSSNLILSSTGQITSKDYASNLKGFFLGPVEMADGSVGSFLEVDEARIRGTLKTTVFEKESVNAVGGQLHVANATTITGSATMSVDDDTMQVANASGFEAGEIILLKKFNSTGFTTEYMKVHSVAREDGGSDTNFSGSLVVTRSLGTTGGSDFMGALGASAQEYTPGQVVVSTGKNGTGYIRLNANPNDTSTPFIDIVERTGDGVYDIDLKARLGDLSGLSQTNLLGVLPVNAGFGLFSENVYLTGGINASFGNIGGWRIENTKITSSDGTTEIISGEGGKIAMGSTLPTDLSSNGIFLSGSGQFNLQSGASDYIRNGTSGFDIAAQNFTLKGGTTLFMDSATNSGVIKLGATATNITETANTGVYIDGTGKFRIGTATSGDNYIHFDGSNVDIKSDTFTLSSGKLSINSSTERIQLGDVSDFLKSHSDKGILLGKDGSEYELFVGQEDGGRIHWNGSTLEVNGSISFTNSPNISTFTNDTGFTDDTVANSKPSVFRQTSIPSTSSPVGSLWYDTDDDNKLYVLVSGTPNVWTPTQDGDIATAQAAADAAQTDATTALTRPKVFRQATTPSTSEPGGSLWYDTSDNNKLYVLVSSLWTATRDGQITTALADAAAAQSTATTANNAATAVSDDLQDVIDGVSVSGAGTFIDANVIYSPLIAGTNGYISNVFKVGNNGITLDGPNRKIYIGTGTYNNSNTPFYFASGSTNVFSLGNKLSWNGAALSVTGTINATAGNFTSTVTIGNGATTGTLAVGTDTNKINIIGTNSDSTTKIAASNGAFEMKGDGTATFANGNITFESDGDITSQDFLIERTRLFGNGEDGSKTLTDGVGTITSDDDGVTMFTESSGVFTQQRDIYCDNLTLDNSLGNVTLKTNGYRIFVKDTLTIESGCVIHNDGTAGNTGSPGSGNNSTSGIVGGDGGSGGAGAPSGTLKGGIAGASGGAGGSVDATGTAEQKASGGGGGGAGGSGGIVLIVARNISNSGTIRCNGGAGGNGGVGGATAP